MLSIPFINKNLNAIRGNDRTYVYLNYEAIAPNATYTFAQDIYLISLNIHWTDTATAGNIITVEIQTNTPTTRFTMRSEEITYADSGAVSHYPMGSFMSNCFGSIGMPDIRKIKNLTTSYASVRVSAFGYYFA